MLQFSLISPFTRRFLKTIKDALPVAYTTKYPIKLTETHAAVLFPLCNLNGNPGLLLEVREKTRAHSGKVRWTPSRFAFVGFHPCWSSSSGGKVDPNDESILHAALREAKEEVGTDVEKIEIMGRLGPPTRSLSGLRFWSYVGGFRMPRPTVLPGDLGEGVLSLKPSQVEVAVVFHLPLNRFTDPRHLRERRRADPPRRSGLNAGSKWAEGSMND